LLAWPGLCCFPSRAYEINCPLKALLFGFLKRAISKLGDMTKSFKHLPESDWKKFKRLRSKALERFCERVLIDIGDIAGDGNRSFHERYGEIFGLIEDRDKAMAHAFDDLRSSQAIFQLGLMYSYGLVEPGELDDFTPETRDRLEPFSPPR
jgi:hypothetical protein